VTTVLIVEGDPAMAAAIADSASAAGFSASIAGSGRRGLAQLRHDRPDACILGRTLPDLDVRRLIELARADGVATPIIVVCAQATEDDRNRVAQIGADDYIFKPFSMNELVERLRAATRRHGRPTEAEADVIEIEELLIDARRVQAYVDGKSANLTPTEYRLLETLARGRGRVISRDEVLLKIWGRHLSHRDRTVDVYVRRLRKKVDDAATTHTFIQTRFGVGYELEPEPKNLSPDSR
jgi:two-component system, OmpR family, KDP operon response regulator KdpE